MGLSVSASWLHLFHRISYQMHTKPPWHLVISVYSNISKYFQGTSVDRMGRFTRDLKQRLLFQNTIVEHYSVQDIVQLEIFIVSFICWPFSIRKRDLIVEPLGICMMVCTTDVLNMALTYITLSLLTGFSLKTTKIIALNLASDVLLCFASDLVIVGEAGIPWYMYLFCMMDPGITDIQPFHEARLLFRNDLCFHLNDFAVMQATCSDRTFLFHKARQVYISCRCLTVRIVKSVYSHITSIHGMCLLLCSANV